ncbi:MAG: peptidylprolyl isomerase, partial [Lachnospiraceae bacterium]|nr:peptidylprolyl isomerase [Lachnospiraceae bacterium]
MKRTIFNKVSRIVSLTLVCGMLLTACNTADGQNVSGNQSGGAVAVEANQEIASTQLMTIEDYTIYMPDLYLYLIQYIYNNGVKADQLDDMTKASIINSAINQMKLETVEYLLALQSDITLTEEQEQMITDTSSRFYNTFGAEFLAAYGIDEECVYRLFERQLYISGITNKAMQDMTADYLEQYQEEYADLQFHSVYYALFPSIQYDEEGNIVKDDDGNAIPLTEEEMEAQLALAEEFHQRAVEGQASGDAAATMEMLVAEYGIGYCSGIERNYTGAYVQELNDVISGLKEGDISDVVKTDAGYMIVRMDNTNDEDYKEYMISFLAQQS